MVRFSTPGRIINSRGANIRDRDSDFFRSVPVNGERFRRMELSLVNMAWVKYLKKGYGRRSTQVMTTAPRQLDLSGWGETVVADSAQKTS